MTVPGMIVRLQDALRARDQLLMVEMSAADALRELRR
jgi:hypothetical protein